MTQRLNLYLTRQLTPELTLKALRAAQAEAQEYKSQTTALRTRLAKTQDTLGKSRQTVADLRPKAKLADDLRTRLASAEQTIREMHAVAARRRALEQGRPPEGDLLYQLRHGASFEAAFVMVARTTATVHDRTVARSLAFRFYDRAATRPLGALLLGVFMCRNEFYETAHGYFRKADQAAVLANAAPEYFGAWMGVNQAAGRQALLDHLAECGATLAAAEACDLVDLLIKHRFYADARVQFRNLPSLRAPALDTAPEIRRKIDWIKDRLAAADTVPPEVAPDQINLAIMDYKLLDRDRTSSNRGDYVQTLAALANICRFQSVTFAGQSPLAQQLETLKADIHPERRLKGPAATVVPVALDRDYASGRQYRPDTWFICNGWFMHRNFRGAIDFPFPPEINPIFISFHVNDPDVLTPETIAELRKYEPIGCRDWTTVYRLRDYGVSCFFSGCLTMTIGQILPKANNPQPRTLAAVESIVEPGDAAGWSVVKSAQVGDHVRDFSLTEGIEDARAMLTGYLNMSRIQTSRLHCYLPCRAMGLDVDFRPKNRADIRFEGLLDLSAADFDRIRDGIETKLETILAAIFAGQSTAEVRALWRKICAQDVAAAEAYYDAPLPPVPVADVAAIRDATPRLIARPSHPEGIELALAVDANLAVELPMVLHSVQDTTAAPVNVHLIHRGLTPDYLAQLTAAFPAFGFDFHDFTNVDYGDDLRLFPHTSTATLDRLYLPEILPEVSKVIYLDIDLLVRADLRALYDIDLGDNVIAGKHSRMPSWRNTVRLMSRASLRLPPEAAWTMRRRLHRQMQIPAETFNAGVIVMNLAQMRAEQFTARHLYLATTCYCNDQDVLNIYAAGRVKAIPPTWNHVPAQDYDTDPKLIHWAGPAKPWGTGPHVLWQAEYDAAFAAGWARMNAVAPPAD